MDIIAGDFARSKSGHDKNDIYVVIRCEGDVVFLCDGRLKPLEKPKKKNVKHIQPIKKLPEDIRQCC